jgi:aspartyl-tRNA(Asn)/glutamyl-tRNA(Gln) amidotransferase subunit B
VRAERFIRDLGLPVYDAEVLTTSRDLADFFEATLEQFNEAKTVSNWLMGELLGYLKASGKELGDVNLTPAAVAELLEMIRDGKVSQNVAKDVFVEMCDSGRPAAQIVKDKELGQISDTSELEGLIAKVIDANPAQVEQFRAGKDKVLGFLVGQVMKETGGRANPKLVNELFRKQLAG